MTTDVCELCGFLRRLQKHHVLARGFEGGRTIEHDLNRLMVCAVCHDVIHSVGTMGVLQIVLARLRGTTYEHVRDTVRKLRNEGM